MSPGIFFAASITLLPGEYPSGTKAILFCAIGLREEEKLCTGNHSVNSEIAALPLQSGALVCSPGWELRTGIIKELLGLRWEGDEGIWRGKEGWKWV